MSGSEAWKNMVEQDRSGEWRLHRWSEISTAPARLRSRVLCSQGCHVNRPYCEQHRATDEMLSHFYCKSKLYVVRLLAVTYINTHVYIDVNRRLSLPVTAAAHSDVVYDSHDDLSSVWKAAYNHQTIGTYCFDDWSSTSKSNVWPPKALFVRECRDTWMLRANFL